MHLDGFTSVLCCTQCSFGSRIAPFAPSFIEAGSAGNQTRSELGSNVLFHGSVGPAPGVFCLKQTWG